LIPAAIVTAALVAAALVTAATVTAALVTAALVAGGLLTAALVAAALVAATGRLLVATAIPASPVAALSFTRRGFPRGRITLGRDGGLPPGVLSRGLRRRRPGPAVWPVDHAVGVEAELLPGPVRTDTASRGVT
jgi:hypothetical protein